MKTLVSLVLVISQVPMALPVNAQSQPAGSMSPTVQTPRAALRDGPIFHGTLREAARLADRYLQAAPQPTPAGQGNPAAKKSKKGKTALVVAGIALAAGGTYLVATSKKEPSGSETVCMPAPYPCSTPSLCRPYCNSVPQYEYHSGRFGTGVALIGGGAVALIAGIRK